MRTLHKATGGGEGNLGQHRQWKLQQLPRLATAHQVGTPTKGNSPGLLFQPPESEFLATVFHNWNTYHNVSQVYFQHYVPAAHQNHLLVTERNESTSYTWGTYAVLPTLLGAGHGVNNLFRDLSQEVTIQSWILKNPKFQYKDDGKSGTQLCNQEANGHKTRRLKETQGEQRVLNHGTHNLNHYYPTQRGDGGGRSAN